MTHPTLAVSNIGKRFRDRTALENVSLALVPGEISVLLGPNGAGKTTLLRLFAGLLTPDTGTVSLDNVPLDSKRWPIVRSRVGLLTETPGLWTRLTVEANLLVYARLHDVRNPASRVASLLEQFGLTDRARSAAGSLSKGMQQKVALARAIVHDPSIVLLDEPTAGLDPEMTVDVRSLITRWRREGRAVLVSTHDLGEAERIADRIAVLRTRLLAVEPLATLLQRVPASRRIRVRLAGDAAPFAGLLQGAFSEGRVEGPLLTCRVTDIDIDVPRLVRELVAAGAEITAVEPEGADLEGIYLHLAKTERAPRAPGADA
ncbi:MAG: ABC transporter ATP-binding protein [Vicinamibacterales bacterium]